MARRGTSVSYSIVLEAGATKCVRGRRHARAHAAGRLSLEGCAPEQEEMERVQNEKRGDRPFSVLALPSARSGNLLDMMSRQRIGILHRSKSSRQLENLRLDNAPAVTGRTDGQQS